MSKTGQLDTFFKKGRQKSEITQSARLTRDFIADGCFWSTHSTCLGVWERQENPAGGENLDLKGPLSTSLSHFLIPETQYLTQFKGWEVYFSSQLQSQVDWLQCRNGRGKLLISLWSGGGEGREGRAEDGDTFPWVTLPVTVPCLLTARQPWHPHDPITFQNHASECIQVRGSFLIPTTIIYV